jgi:hypothetical protein
MHIGWMAALLFAQIAVAVFALLFLIPMKELGRYFFKFHGTLLLALTAVSLAFRWHLEQRYGKAMLPSMLAYGAFWFGLAALRWLWHQGRRVRIFEGVVLVAGLAGLAADMALLFTETVPAPLAARWLMLAAFPVESLVLGSVTLAMILGHWYLVVPNLDIGHLQKLAMLFGFALGFRTLFFALALALHWEPYGRMVFLLDHLELFHAYGVFFWQRILFGILTPIGLAWMIWKTAQMRSTQSATGILYVAMVLVLVGEFIGKYFLVRYHIPL